MSVITVRSCISKPEFWVLTGTIMLPMNLILAIVFWVKAKIWRTGERARAARCLNVQLTYTLVFFLPILLAEFLSSPSPALQELFPGGAPRTMIAGLVFGLTGLAGVIITCFSNTRMFARRGARGTSYRGSPCGFDSSGSEQKRAASRSMLDDTGRVRRGKSALRCQGSRRPMPVRKILLPRK